MGELLRAALCADRATRNSRGGAQDARCDRAKPAAFRRYRRVAYPARSGRRIWFGPRDAQARVGGALRARILLDARRQARDFERPRAMRTVAKRAASEPLRARSYAVGRRRVSRELSRLDSVPARDRGLDAATIASAVSSAAHVGILIANQAGSL